MAQKIRFEFISEGFQEVLNSPGVTGLVNSTGEAIRARAGEGFSGEPFQAHFGGSPRPAYIVRAETREARLAEAMNKTLSKAVR